MIRFAPICLAESTPKRPTAPSPTTKTVDPGFTLAASAANQPVPKTSDVASRLGITSLEGRSLVCDQSAVGKRNTQQAGLRAAHKLASNARGLVTIPADHADVIRGCKR